MSNPATLADLAEKARLANSPSAALDQSRPNDVIGLLSVSRFEFANAGRSGRLEAINASEPSATASLLSIRRIGDAVTGDRSVEHGNLGTRQASALPVTMPSTMPKGSSEEFRAPASSHWSGDAWVLWRPGGSGIASGLAAPTYGGSQAGAVVRYSLAPEGLGDTALFVRAVRALDPSHDGDLAVGLAVRPLPSLPATVHGEVRLSSRGSSVEARPAAFVAAGFDEEIEGHGIATRGYAQAGYVGGRDATGFVDGSVVAEARVLPLSEPRLTAGAGAWGGAQRGAGRLDVGPTVSMKLRLGDTSARLSADYRLRIAGNAAPAAGAALTLSAGF